MNIAQYVKAKSLEETWELNQKKTAVVFGGGCWLRLSPQRRIQTAIDLSGLGLDTMTETDTAIHLGAMVTLRQLETAPALLTATDGAIKEALRHIVGVQFRNLATVGGSIFGRFGFSDVLTLFLTLEAEVELHRGGRMPLAEFAKQGGGNDILTQIIIPKKKRRTAYTSLRLNATDFPILACSVVRTADTLLCAVGARPARAEVRAFEGTRGLTEADATAVATEVAASMNFEDNTRGSAAYRRDMAVELCRRLLLQTGKEEA